VRLTCLSECLDYRETKLRFNNKSHWGSNPRPCFQQESTVEILKRFAAEKSKPLLIQQKWRKSSNFRRFSPKSTGSGTSFELFGGGFWAGEIAFPCWIVAVSFPALLAIIRPRSGNFLKIQEEGSQSFGIVIFIGL